MRKLVIVLVILVLIVGGIKLVDYILAKRGPTPGTVQDEALLAGREARELSGRGRRLFPRHGLRRH